MAPGILQPSQYPWLQSPVELNCKVLTNLRNLNQVSHQNWQEDEQARKQCHVVWADTHMVEHTKRQGGGLRSVRGDLGSWSSFLKLPRMPLLHLAFRRYGV